jgi:hypothetical protein
VSNLVADSKASSRGFKTSTRDNYFLFFPISDARYVNLEMVSDRQKPNLFDLFDCKAQHFCCHRSRIDRQQFERRQLPSFTRLDQSRELPH